MPSQGFVLAKKAKEKKKKKKHKKKLLIVKIDLWAFVCENNDNFRK